MSLVLTIPEQSRDKQKQVETDISQTEHWLQRLPVLNASGSLQQIHQALFELNRIPLKVKQRLSLLELYRQPIQTIAEELEQRFIMASFPLSPELKAQARQLRNAHFELSYGYKAIIMDLTHGWRPNSSHPNLALSLHRAVRALSETYAKSAYYHAEPPPGVWLEIHQLRSVSAQLEF